MPHPARVGEFRGRGSRCTSLMKLRKYETPEPSHIHVPRPSRTEGGSTKLSRAEPLNQSVLMDDEAKQSCLLRDIE